MPIEMPQPWPAALAHIPPDTPSLAIAICDRALSDIVVCETPRSSNRGGRIDEYNRRAGAPLGSYWCASAATAWVVDAGGDVPPTDRAVCETIMRWAIAQQLWFSTPVIGAFVLYGTPDGHGSWKVNDAGHYAHHVGIVVRVLPYLVSFEGNTAFSGFSVNGEAVLAKLIDTTRVLGYAHPRVRSSP